MLSTNSGYNMLNRYQWKCKIAFRDIFNSVFKVCKWGTTRKLVTRLILVMLHAVGMAQSHFMKHVLWGLGYGGVRRLVTPVLRSEYVFLVGLCR